MLFVYFQEEKKNMLQTMHDLLKRREYLFSNTWVIEFNKSMPNVVLWTEFNVYDEYMYCQNKRRVRKNLRTIFVRLLDSIILRLPNRNHLSLIQIETMVRVSDEQSLCGRRGHAYLPRPTAVPEPCAPRRIEPPRWRTWPTMSDWTAEKQSKLNFTVHKLRT